MTNTLDAASLPLQGRHLIEASAGTGKTFTVANLYVRLLIDEQQIEPPTVENILVVTFTDAATEELRARLRSRITAALQVLDGEFTEDADPTLLNVLEPHKGIPKTRARLELACQSMDQAAIYTIHGFCGLVLREQAFESGELFDAELQADVEALKIQAAQAWWRGSITPLSADETKLIPKAWRSPSAVLNRLSPILTDPSGALVPTFTDTELQQAKADYETIWQRFSTAWAADRLQWPEQVAAGVADKLINKGKAPNIFTTDTVAAAVETATSLAQQHSAPSQIDQSLMLLGNAAISASANKRKNNPPQSDLGDQIDALVTAFNQLKLQKLVALQGNAQTIIGSDLAQRKLLARQRTFDDLLLQLHKALYSNGGERLTGLLRTRYPVALIDEFQDTDRIQYEIFDKLFPVQADPAAALYLIGDPKQSIYRFRGADINIYLRARNSADARHSLDKNWRSSKNLISALNTLYAQSNHPFGAADIHYKPVSAGGRAEGHALTVAGQTLAPLQFDTVMVSDDKLPVIGDSTSALATRCAQRVAWLLAKDNATLGETPVTAKDIAVLVWTHAHAEAIRRALLAVGVVSAMQSRESVFKSPEALDLMALLRVIAKPGDASSLSRVLVSPLGGYSANELLNLRNDAVAWQGIEDNVQRCREQFQQAGPQAALLRFMALFNSRVKAFSAVSANTRGVDRILGNYLHIADVLQTAWQDQPDLTALLKAAQRWREQPADEALQLRLESDEALVQIVTVHKSKGLQYPVVMLPFACMGKDPTTTGDVVTYNEDGQPRLDVGSDQLSARQAHETQAQKDESMRALYVALTRAEQSCWIGVTANKNARYAAIWNLADVSFPLKFSSSSDCQQPIQDALRKLTQNSPQIAIPEALQAHHTLPVTIQTNTAQQARISTRTVHASWRVGSYTALARGATHASEQPDHDAADVPAVRPEIPDYQSPFHFPRGAQAGTLIHAVFEHLDFRTTSSDHLQSYAEHQLRAHNVDTKWTPALCQLLRNTLDTPLNDNGFSLGLLDKKDRLDELGFHFPVASLNADALVTLLRQHKVLGTEDNLVFDRLDGYMTGFIDLTFRHNGRWYIADYKSNHLGYNTTDYHPEALPEAMQHHRYDLQYLIYAVALRRYLASRLSNFNSARDFGGVYYLFVRGMAGNAALKEPEGVFAARPSEPLLDALDQLLVKDTDHA